MSRAIALDGLTPAVLKEAHAYRADPGRMRYGHITNTDARARGIAPCQVLVDGVDVSMKAVETDDVNGWAIVRDFPGAARSILYGEVEVRLIDRNRRGRSYRETVGDDVLRGWVKR